MAKTQWIILFVTFCLSFLSFGLIIVSFATTHWIDAEAENPQFRNSIINYGLFAGTLQRQLTSSPAYFDLTMVCLFEENKCIFSCQATVEERESEIRKLINDEELSVCPRVQSKHITFNEERYYLNEEINKQNSTLSSNYLGTSLIDNNVKITSLIGQKMLNAGLWVTTLIFLSIAILFSFISGVFSLVNIILNPVEPMLNIFGLYIWNGIASGSSLMTLIMWGSMFGSSIIDNVAITDTLDKNANFTSEGLAANGFSYWLLLCPTLLHCGNIGLLRLRNYLIDKEPPPPTITVEKNDFTILLY